MGLHFICVKHVKHQLKQVALIVVPSADELENGVPTNTAPPPPYAGRQP